MAEAQTTAKVSIDDQGRIIITGMQLTEALRGAGGAGGEGSRLLFASNNVIQCGCNVVAGCG